MASKRQKIADEPGGFKNIKHMTKLNEDSELYRGIFWIKDVDNPTAEWFFQIPTDEYGNSSYIFNSKKGNTYNHELTWNELHQKKPYNYYPRGRVEISNGIAKIFINPNLNTEKIINLVKSEFNLTERNGIKKIKVIPDYSEHYKCYLDGGYRGK